MQQSANQPVIAVVIVSFNTADLLRRCLRSLQACRLPLQIIVVDNYSHDESAAMVRREFPAVRLHVASENRGFAAANNIGLHMLGFGTPNTAPRPDYVLLLNPDTEVYVGALEALVSFLQAHPRVAMAAPRLYNPDGSLQHGAFRFPTLSMSLLDVFPPGAVLPGRLYGSWWHGRYPAEIRQHREPFPIDHPLGACMLVRRAAIEEVGLLDDGYFLYSEEVDWCWRMRRAGWAIWQVPAAHVLHVGGASSQQVRVRSFIELHRSRLRFFQRHYSVNFVYAHRSIVQAGMVYATLRAWRLYTRRIIKVGELRARLLAYGRVVQL
ncbi:MAG: glycosyltransferase family 2 protein [Chloroflexaceae bacterium]|nr:glycosyltransferase family 2 protein [Chloroflexaceae bacterium]